MKHGSKIVTTTNTPLFSQVDGVFRPIILFAHHFGRNFYKLHELFRLFPLLFQLMVKPHAINIQLVVKAVLFHNKLDIDGQTACDQYPTCCKSSFVSQQVGY